MAETVRNEEQIKELGQKVEHLSEEKPKAQTTTACAAAFPWPPWAKRRYVRKCSLFPPRSIFPMHGLPKRGPLCGGEASDALQHPAEFHGCCCFCSLCHHPEIPDGRAARRTSVA